MHHVEADLNNLTLMPALPATVEVDDNGDDTEEEE